MSNYSSYLVIVYIKIFLEFLLQYYRNHGSSYMISILIHRGCNLQGKKWKTLQDWPCHSAVYVVTSILFCDIFLIKEEKILKNSQVKKKETGEYAYTRMCLGELKISHAFVYAMLCIDFLSLSGTRVLSVSDIFPALSLAFAARLVGMSMPSILELPKT